MMNALKYKRLFISPFLGLAIVLLAATFIASCKGDEAASPQGFNTELLIVNASPDALPVGLYIDNVIQNGRATYRFPNASSYFYLTTLNQPFQIRRTNATRDTIVTVRDTLAANTRYSLFVTGLAIDNTLTAIFVADTSSLPKVGNGKVRFINASPRSQGFDVYANGTKAFSNAQFKSVSKFIEVPAGTYRFNVTPVGSSDILGFVPGVSIQDGRLYTIYTRGLVGRTDTAAFGAGVISNSK